MSNELGPDRVIPGYSYTTTQPEGCVILSNEGLLKYPPISVPTAVKKACLAASNKTAMAVKRNGAWKTWTYEQYLLDIRKTAKGFIKLGLDPLHCVCIFGFNCPEWFLSDLGAIFSGGIVTGLYPTNSPETNAYLMNDSRCQILVVENVDTLAKISSIRKELPFLKNIVIIDDTGFKKEDGIFTWRELMELGGKVEDRVLNSRLDEIAINQCCTLIYTSGTTGNPKGVMLSHDNVTFTIRTCLDRHQWYASEIVIVSYLPLSHVAANMMDIHAALLAHGTVYFADKMALKGSLLQTLREVRPTKFLGVPRIWEKFQEGMIGKARHVKGGKKKISETIKKAGLSYHLQGKNGLIYNIGDKMVLRKIKVALGLDKCTEFFCGSAPLSPETMKYFLSVNIVIQEMYGMSECTGILSTNTSRRIKFETVGQVLPGVEGIVQSSNGFEGEICMKGRNVMMGYLFREEDTKKTIDKDNWLHSGDIGEIDEQGFLRITGRIKDIIITAGGENVAPFLMEENIKGELPCLSQVILIGDRRKFISAFLTFQVVVNKSTDIPTDKLTKQVIDWCESVGSTAKTIEDILRGPDVSVMRAIQCGIDRANRKAISNATRVQKWTILPVDLCVENGELGPTLKLKRNFFEKKHSKSIDKFYN